MNPSPSPQPTLHFTSSTYIAYRVKNSRGDFDGMRYGEGFHSYLNLQNCTDLPDKEWCDKLFHAPYEEAKAMIESRILK